MTKLRSYVFAPQLLGDGGPLGRPARLRHHPERRPDPVRGEEGVRRRLTTIAQREKVAAEDASVWVLNGTGTEGQATDIATYLTWSGMQASAPNQKPEEQPAATTIRVYNGAETPHPADDRLPGEDVRRPGGSRGRPGRARGRHRHDRSGHPEAHDPERALGARASREAVGALTPDLPKPDGTRWRTWTRPGRSDALLQVGRGTGARGACADRRTLGSPRVSDAPDTTTSIASRTTERAPRRCRSAGLPSTGSPR